MHLNKFWWVLTEEDEKEKKRCKKVPITSKKIIEGIYFKFLIWTDPKKKSNHVVRS